MILLSNFYKIIMVYIFYTLLTQQIWDKKIYNKIMIVLFVVKKYMKKEKISNIMKHKRIEKVHSETRKLHCDWASISMKAIHQ